MAPFSLSSSSKRICPLIIVARSKCQTPRPTGMTDETARRQLRRIMRSFTAGSILHLLGEIFEERAEEARRGGDEIRLEQCDSASKTLFVVGLGRRFGLPEVGEETTIKTSCTLQVVDDVRRRRGAR